MNLANHMMCFNIYKLIAFMNKNQIITKQNFKPLFYIGFQSTKYLEIYIYVFCLFRAAPVAYGSSQARGLIRSAATGLHHSHSNAGSEPHPRPTPQLTATRDP